MTGQRYNPGRLKMYTLYRGWVNLGQWFEAQSERSAAGQNCKEGQNACSKVSQTTIGKGNHLARSCGKSVELQYYFLCFTYTLTFIYCFHFSQSDNENDNDRKCSFLKWWKMRCWLREIQQLLSIAVSLWADVLIFLSFVPFKLPQFYDYSWVVTTCTLHIVRAQHWL